MKDWKHFLKLLDRGEDILVLLFFLCFFSIGIYGLYDSLLVYKLANDDSILKYKPGYEGAISEKELQGRMVAWLTLDGTGIDYPVMQGDTNYEYLNKNPFGEYSLSGSIFLDAANKSDFSDEYSLLYGHHMENGYMFGALDQYRKEDFFLENSSGTLLVGKEKKKITIFAVLTVMATENTLFEVENRTKKEVLDLIQASAFLYRQVKTEKLIAFSTCRYPDTAERTVVVGTFS